ncbi:protein MAINTENANCE OF MERISTEMS-like [Vicia villosa]|uniref:protein MAINTENANCE OF MERISTEMS-like n=1 Tax=Vicia villosa TaxID=3911 RepID=UPI00273C1091|nr:protein MAINTENANCE OF MERISTEMS-like [Vicia villosa]
MTVTLDDVHSLSHLSIAGMFFTPVHRDQATAMHMVMDALEVDKLVVLKEFGDTQGFHLRMSWSRKVYQEILDLGRYQAATRVHMLHIVACTLFADKSEVYINVLYLSLLSDLETPYWTKGVAALTMLYTTFDAASRPDTRQFVGYLSLLQVEGQTHLRGVIEYRRRLDALTLDDVIWTPYTGHREDLPFDVSSLYSGYVRWESHVAKHLPERYLRQYGYIQGMPRPVPKTLAGGIDR